jgi:hypothetical protein
MLNRRYLLLLGAILVVSPACGSATGGGSEFSDFSTATETSSQPESAPPADLPPVNWDNPTGDPAVSSAAAAEQQMPIPIIVPSDLGSPSQIFASGDDRAAENRVVTFMFDSDKYGRVAVIESSAQLGKSEWDTFMQSAVAANDDPGTSGTAKIVQIRDGINGLATTTEDGSWSQLDWYEDGDLEINVLGPTLSADQAVEIADGLGSRSAQ